MRNAGLPIRSTVVSRFIGLVWWSTASAFADGTWEPRAAMFIPRQETGAATVNGKVYVIGGLTGGPPTQNTNTVEVYDVATDSWSFAAPLPFGVDHMGCAEAGGVVYSVGGYDIMRKPRSDAFAFIPDANVWVPIAPLPEPRAGCWAAGHAGKLYVFGGVNAAGSATDTTFIYDPASDTWSSGAPMPTRREHLTAVTAGKHIYVVGGRVGGTSTTAFERYNPNTDKWKVMAPMPTARAAAFTGTFDGVHIYIAGGETPQLFSVNEVYDIVTDTWDTDTGMAVPRHGLAAVAVAGGILAPGGGTIQGLRPSGYTDLFVPDEASLPAVAPTGIFAAAVAVAVLGVCYLRAVRIRASKSS